MTSQDILHDPFSSYREMSSTRSICLPPRYIGNISQGIRDHLDSEINLFCTDLDSVVISYDNLKLLNAVGSILDDSPFLHFRVQADYIVFKPTIGCILKGVVNKVSKDHVGCLVHSRFNASIHRPRHNLNGWRGSQLQQGDEFPFEVLDIYSNNAVISLKGNLVEEKVIQNYLNDLQKGNNADENVDSTSQDMCVDSAGEITLDSDPTPRKKKKRKASKEIEDTVDSSNMEVSLTDETSPKKKKKKKRSKSDKSDLEKSEPLQIENKQESSVMITPILSRKRRHSMELESFTVTPKRVRFDASVQAFSPEYGSKKKKTMSGSESEISSEVTDTSLMDSSILDDSGSGKKKKKKKKHKKKDEENVEDEFTKVKDSYENSEIDVNQNSFQNSVDTTPDHSESSTPKKKHKKKKHKEPSLLGETDSVSGKTSTVAGESLEAYCASDLTGDFNGEITSGKKKKDSVGDSSISDEFTQIKVKKRKKKKENN